MEVNSKSGFNLTEFTWRVEIGKATWRIQNFSSFKKDQRLCSEIFVVDGNKWRILIFPKGNKEVDHLSIYLDVADSATLPSGWSRFAQVGFAVIDQIDRTSSTTNVLAHEFNAKASNWGFPSFLALSELEDSKRGYLVNDACLVEAYISTDKTEGLISRELILETDGIKAAIGNQTSLKTEPVRITLLSFPPDQAIEPEEPTEEDIKTFFTSIESELSSSDTVFSKEEAKETLAKLDEALNMTPVNFYDSEKFSSLEKAFKLTFTRKLDGNVIRYKEVESEVKQVEQKLAVLLAERKGIFTSSKEIKTELEAVGKECAEYESTAKAAEAGWGRIKDLISSIKGRF
ncbi:hypothetical protein V6N11_054171 [Hibiscus sabdariffa]|uniref:MATH domain-containing protein n=1 Tax=Hibiscus sabdariffa TaxID=183260 RepID=A0ABR2S3Y1_9ROSI